MCSTHLQPQQHKRRFCQVGSQRTFFTPQNVSDLLPDAGEAAAVAPHPRCVRVNTLKLSVQEAVTQLKEGGRTSVSRDPLIPELLVLPPGTDLHDHPLVGDGGLVLQSKASCMSAAALAPKPGWTVVDCCAAPGNKTTHAAALMQVRPQGINWQVECSTRSACSYLELICCAYPACITSICFH